jgi:heme-degrading monooxygenase HmoA
MFVAMSRFRIANGMAAAVQEAFRNRPHLVDEAPGFIRMDVISARECPGDIRLITFWVDEASYRVWHDSHAYHESHAGIPKGLKLVPGSVAIEFVRTHHELRGGPCTRNAPRS